MNRLLFSLLLITSCLLSYGQEISALQLIEKSCNYHDPDRIMAGKGIVLHLEEPRNNDKPRITTLFFKPSKNIYIIKQENEEQTIRYEFIKDKLSISLNGSTDYTESDIQKFKLTKERALLLKNYYYYLWSLPCNLIHPDAQVEDKVLKKRFGGRELLECTVSYPSIVDSDTWRFYFDPNTYALSGYMFFNKNSDGEYILIEGEQRYNSIKIPSNRSWYDNHDDQFLATDRLIKIEKYKTP